MIRRIFVEHIADTEIGNVVRKSCFVVCADQSSSVGIQLLRSLSLYFGYRGGGLRRVGMGVPSVGSPRWDASGRHRVTHAAAIGGYSHIVCSRQLRPRELRGQGWRRRLRFPKRFDVASGQGRIFDRVFRWTAAFCGCLQFHSL
jgi:hypothetical protein